MAWNFRRDPICKAQLPIIAGATNLNIGELVRRSSNHGYYVDGLDWNALSTGLGASPTAEHVIVGICQVASTASSTDPAYVAKVTPYDELAVPVSTAVSSTWLAPGNIGTYMFVYDSSHVNGSTGATDFTYTSDAQAILVMTGYSTREKVVYGYIPAIHVS